MWIDKTSVDAWEHALGRLERGHAVTWPVSRRGEPAIHLVPDDDHCLHATVNDSEIPVGLKLQLTLEHDWIDDQRVLLEETRRRFPGLVGDL